MTRDTPIHDQLAGIATCGARAIGLGGRELVCTLAAHPAETGHTDGVAWWTERSQLVELEPALEERWSRGDTIELVVLVVMAALVGSFGGALLAVWFA